MISNTEFGFDVDEVVDRDGGDDCVLVASGDTYRYRGSLKQAGFRWDAKSRCWFASWHSEMVSVEDVERLLWDPSCGNLRRGEARALALELTWRVVSTGEEAA